MNEEELLNLKKALGFDTDNTAASTSYDDVFDIRKALDTGSGSTGSVLVPTVIDAGIRLFVEQRSPLWNIIPKKTAEGMTWNYKEKNGIQAASFGSELGALPAAGHSTYQNRSKDIKSVYIRGEISGQLIAASRTFINVASAEIADASLGMVRTLEQELITADSAVNTDKFDGLAKQITTNVFGDTTGDGLGTDQELSLKFMDQLMTAAVGSDPTHFIMGVPMYLKLWSILQPQVRYMDKTVVAGGFEVPTYGGKPIITTRDNTSYFADKILAPDMNLIYIPVLTPFSYEELAHTRDSLDFFIKTYLCVVVEGAARHHAKLTDVTSTIA